MKYLTYIFFWFILFSWISSFGNSRFKGIEKIDTTNFKDISYTIGIRPIRGELRAGINFNISRINKDGWLVHKSKASIGPEIGYQIYSINDDSYEVYNPPNMVDRSTYISNVFVLDHSYWIGIRYQETYSTNGEKFKISVAPFFFSGSNKNVSYTYYDWPGIYQRSQEYSGGDLQLRNYGVECQVSQPILSSSNFSLELNIGGSLFYQKNYVRFNEYRSDDGYGNTYYLNNETGMTRIEINRPGIRFHLGMYLLF